MIFPSFVHSSIHHRNKTPSFLGHEEEKAFSSCLIMHAKPAHKKRKTKKKPKLYRVERELSVQLSLTNSDQSSLPSRYPSCRLKSEKNATDLKKKKKKPIEQNTRGKERKKIFKKSFRGSVNLRQENIMRNEGGGDFVPTFRPAN